jgi:hypothetical protein
VVKHPESFGLPNPNPYNIQLLCHLIRQTRHSQSQTAVDVRHCEHSTLPNSIPATEKTEIELLIISSQTRLKIHLTREREISN